MTTYEVLATHKALAEYTGVVHYPCRHMTSLCPNQCNHGQDAAQFKILEYLEYAKTGQYGDDKQDVYRVRIDQKNPQEQQDPAIVATINSLTPGQKVKLFWEHIYVTDGATNSKYPQRPIRSVELA
jgi:hypothetical protein